MPRTSVEFVSRKGAKARRCRACREAASFFHAAPNRDDRRMGGLAAASQPLRAFAPSRETRNPDFSDPAKRKPARSTTGPGRHRRYRLARIVAEQDVDAGPQIGENGRAPGREREWRKWRMGWAQGNEKKKKQ